MDRKLILQLLLNKTEEIQALLKHFNTNPNELESGLDLLSYRIESLGREFDLLRNDIPASPVSAVIRPEKEELVEEQIAMPEEKPAVEDTSVTKEEPIIEKEPVTEKLIEPVETVSQQMETPGLNGDNKDEENSILNDQLQASSSGVLGEQLSSHRLEDVQSAIGINDRFQFIRELFDNNADAYNSAIQKVNDSANFLQVENWIKENQNWDMENPTVNQFIEIVKRKF